MRFGAAGDDVIVRHWGRLAVRRWGDPGGRPVFLLHGTPGSRLGVRPHERDLNRLGVCLITYDRPGYGQSDPSHGRSVADSAADVELIADHYGYDRFLVVGRSGGGPHALACAALLPARVGAVASLLGLAPFDADGLNWFDGMSDSNRAEYQAAMSGRSALSIRLFPEVVAIRANPGHLVDRLISEASPTDRALLRDPAYREVLVENYSEAVRDCLDGWVSDSLAFVRPWQFDPGSISVPTLLWHGLDDIYSPVEHARWLAAHIPGAELRIVASTGHFDVMTAQLDAIVWLLDHDGGRPRGNLPPRAATERVGANAGFAALGLDSNSMRNAPDPDASGDAPYFFLAYAHTSEQQWVKKLFRDLCTEIRERTAVPPTAQVGFMDDLVSIGADWRDSLNDALAACRTFLPLYSPRYFQREECGREWYAFQQRIFWHRTKFADIPSAIVPVLWAPVRDEEMPDAARSIQFDHARLGAIYAEEGFYTLIKNDSYRDVYLTALQRLAKQIIKSAEESRLAPCDPDSFSGLHNAFIQQNHMLPVNRRRTITALAPLSIQLWDDSGGDMYENVALESSLYDPAPQQLLSKGANTIDRLRSGRSIARNLEQYPDLTSSTVDPPRRDFPVQPRLSGPTVLPGESSE